MAILFKLTYKFNAMHTIIAADFLLQKLITFIWKCKRSTIAKTILKKNKVREVTLPISKNAKKLQYSRLFDTGIKKDKQIQVIKLSQMTNASIYGQLIFDKSAKIIHVGKNGLTNK